MLNKKTAVVGSIILFVLIIVYIGRDAIHISYAKLFKKSVVVEHYNSKGRLNGTFILFDKGNVDITANYTDGLREGYLTEFYSNGQIKSKVLFKNDKMNGNDTGYYENGVLKYITPYWNNKYHGSGYHYSTKGKLTNYNGLNLNEPFCLIKYDEDGSVLQILGDVFGSNIYSYDPHADTALILTTNQRYYKIYDLYITVATPPKLKPQILITINNNTFKNPPILNNTIKIQNAFTSDGIYNLKIIGAFLNGQNIVVKVDTLMEQITKY